MTLSTSNTNEQELTRAPQGSASNTDWSSNSAQIPDISDRKRISSYPEPSASLSDSLMSTRISQFPDNFHQSKSAPSKSANEQFTPVRKMEYPPEDEVPLKRVKVDTSFDAALARRRHSLQALSAMRELKNAIISPAKVNNAPFETIDNILERHERFCVQIFGLNPKLGSNQELLCSSSNLLRALFSKIGKPFTVENEKTFSLIALFVCDRLMVAERLKLPLSSMTKHQSWNLILDELDNFAHMNVIENEKNQVLSQIASSLKKQDAQVRVLYKKFTETFDYLFLYSPFGTTFWSLAMDREPPLALPQDLQRYSKYVFMSIWCQFLYFKSTMGSELDSEDKQIAFLGYIMSVSYDNIHPSLKKELEESDQCFVNSSNVSDRYKFLLVRLNVDEIPLEEFRSKIEATSLEMFGQIDALDFAFVVDPECGPYSLYSVYEKIFSCYETAISTPDSLTIDGRIYLKQDNLKLFEYTTPSKLLMTPPRSTGRATSVRPGAARNLMSSSFSHMPATPMSARHFNFTMKLPVVATSIQDLEASRNRLQYLAQNYSDVVVSEKLQSYFDAANIEKHDSPFTWMHSKMQSIASDVGELGMLVPHFPMILKLYSRWMENMLVAEHDRTGVTNFSTWLADVDFHKSLLACAAELVRFCFLEAGSVSQAPSVSFESIISALEVGVFNFGLLIENVIKFEPNLTWIMVKRLKELEERIVESEAWSEEEPLYSLMRHESLLAISKNSNGGNDSFQSGESDSVSTEQNPPKMIKIDVPNQISMAVPFSPRKAIQVISEKEPSLYGSVVLEKQHDDLVVASQGSSKLTKLELFFRKFFRLLHLRLHTFSRKLNLSESIVNNIWDTMVYALEREENLRLLFGRHMDQLLICSIYGICKIMDEERKFKEIINVYREQPQFIESTYRSVNDGKGGRVDIIMFYNAVFLPSMKAVIYGFKEKAGAKKPVIHVDHCPLPVMPDLSSPRRVSQQHSIFVSPWRSSASVSGTRMHSKNFVPASPRQWLMVNNQGWSQNPSLGLDSVSTMTPITKRLYSFGEEATSPITMPGTKSILGKRSARKLDFSNVSSSQQ